MGDVNATIAALTVFVTALTGLVPIVWTLWRRMSAQGRRIDRIWRGRMIRAFVEAQDKDLVVELVSPDHFNPEAEMLAVALRPNAYAAYAPIKRELLAFREEHKFASDAEFAEAIEDKFGPWLARYVCPVLGVTNYACILMAVSVANGIEPYGSKEE